MERPSALRLLQCDLNARPLSERGLRLLADAIAIGLEEAPSPVWVRAASRDRRRARARVLSLRDDRQPAAVIRGLARYRDDARQLMRVNATINEILEIAGVRRSGISHPLSGLSTAGEVEVSVTSEAYAGLAALGEGLLVVTVHVVENWSPGDVVLELSQHIGVREDYAVEDLVSRAADRLRVESIVASGPRSAGAREGR